MSSEGKQEISKNTTLTRETVNGKWKIFEKINISTNLKKLSRTQRIFVGVYAASVVTNFMFSTYSDGKTELLKWRKNHSTTTNKQEKYLQEWSAVKKGCQEHWFGNLWDSLFFPCTLATNVVPLVIINLNKE